MKLTTLIKIEQQWFHIQFNETEGLVVGIDRFKTPILVCADHIKCFLKLLARVTFTKYIFCMHVFQTLIFVLYKRFCSKEENDRCKGAPLYT